MEGLSSPAINVVKRLAAFKNPDFYRAQAMRMPTYDKPRVICCADITEKYVALPRGCEKALCDMRQNRLVQMAKLLSPVILNGVCVTVVTRPPEDFKEQEKDAINQNAEFLADCGLQVKFKPDFHQKFTVIDQKIAWYGSVNFLSFGNHEESVMRFENYDLAEQLIDTVT